MKNNSLDDIVKCNIEISSPASNEETFDTILIIVPQPEGDGLSVEHAFEISRAVDLEDYGYSTTSEAYIAASVAFSQNPAPAKILVYARKTNDSRNETITTALNSVASEKAFYGFHLTSFTSAQEVKEASDWAEANNKLYGFEYTTLEACPITTNVAFRTFGIFAGLADAEEQPEENKYLALAWMAKTFGYAPGSETWAFKELSRVVPSMLNTAQKTALETRNISSYRRYAGSNVTFGGQVLAGEWIDVIRFRDWLKSNIQHQVFNVIKTNKKVEFTDNGISLIEGAIETALKEGQEVGGIADTSYDADGNEIPGYTVTVPRASDFTEAEKKTRNLTGCRWTAKLAGAIHAVEISGYLTF